MNVKKRTKLFLVPLLLSGVIACGNNNGAQTQSNDPLGRLNDSDGMRATNDGQVYENPYNHNYNGDYDGVRPYTNTVNDVQSARDVSARVREVANQVPGVARATAVVQGVDIVVGIDGTQGMNRKTLEMKVKQSVKKSEPGYNVFVTTDSDIHHRIRSHFTNMNNVKSSNVRNGIGEIIYDIGRSDGRS